MKTCPQCGHRTADAARWCTACRYSYLASPSPAAPSASPALAQASGTGCPLCGGPKGTTRLTIRRILETRKYGIPLVLRLRVTDYQQGSVEGVCQACGWRLFRQRWVAWGLGWIPVALLFGLAAGLGSPALGILGGLALLLHLKGLFYSWLDDWVWGRDLVQRLGLPEGDYHIPASVGHVVGRGLLGPYLAVLGLVGVMVAVGRVLER